MPKIFQPWLALFGVTGCFIIMFVSTTSLFWTGHPRPNVVAAFEAIPVLLVLIWLTLKLRRYIRAHGLLKSPDITTTQDPQHFWWINTDHADLLQTIDTIVYLKNSQRDAERAGPAHESDDWGN